MATAPQLPELDFERMTAEELLPWAYEEYGERVCLTCSWQKQSSVLVHMVSELGLPLDAGENVIAFALRAEGRTLIAIAPRLFAKIEGWGGARLPLPREFPQTFRNVLTGREIRARDGNLPLAQVSTDFPLGLLMDAT